MDIGVNMAPEIPEAFLFPIQDDQDKLLSLMIRKRKKWRGILRAIQLQQAFFQIKKLLLVGSFGDAHLHCPAFFHITQPSAGWAFFCRQTAGRPASAAGDLDGGLAGVGVAVDDLSPGTFTIRAYTGLVCVFSHADRALDVFSKCDGFDAFLEGFLVIHPDCNADRVGRRKFFLFIRRILSVLFTGAAVPVLRLKGVF